MADFYLARSLLVGEQVLTEDALLSNGGVILVLAEPGAGKTELLNSLSEKLSTVRMRASIFRHATSPGPRSSLVIDAMDEVTRLNKLASQEIIAKASQVSAKLTIFAGRSSEWDEGLTEFAAQCFGVSPIVARLRPFDSEDQAILFAHRFPAHSFMDFQRQVYKFELAPLLGNPQFFQLLGSAYSYGESAFSSKREIFYSSVRQLAYEGNSDVKWSEPRPPQSEIVDLAGRIFAKILLSGASGAALSESSSDLDFPYLYSLIEVGDKALFLLDTQLVKPTSESDRIEPVHRIVAEYCAAAYLTAKIEDPADKLTAGRVFAVIAPNSVTRSELRGLLGWLAALGSADMQLRAIEIDPYAVMANGDPGQLELKSKKHLIQCLRKLALIDPYFRRSDLWRKFNVGNFFNDGIADDVRAALKESNSLRTLLLELLAESQMADDVVAELAAIVENQSEDFSSRMLALTVIPDHKSVDLLHVASELLCEATPSSYELAAIAAKKVGISAFGMSRLTELLGGAATLYPDDYSSKRIRVPRYNVSILIRSLGRDDIKPALDSLAGQITCKCGAGENKVCTCRNGISRIIGLVLDQFFNVVLPGEVDAKELYHWVKDLCYSNYNSRPGKCVSFLLENHDLRRSVQQLYLERAMSQADAYRLVGRLYQGTTHHGILVQLGDIEALVQFSFERGLNYVWKALHVRHTMHRQPQGPNAIRALQRRHSRQSGEVLRLWASCERDWRQSNHQSLRWKRRRTKASLSSEVAPDEIKYIRDNIELIEAGRHWNILRAIASDYMYCEAHILSNFDDSETPIRALKNCFTYLAPHVPDLSDFTIRSGNDVALVLTAGCLAKFRSKESLEDLSPKILQVVRAALHSFPTYADGEQTNLAEEIDGLIFKSNADVEAFLTKFIVPQLLSVKSGHVPVEWLKEEKIFSQNNTAFALKWLSDFPFARPVSVESLFKMVVNTSNYDEILPIIEARIADVPPKKFPFEGLSDAKAWESRMLFWRISAFIYRTPSWKSAWQIVVQDHTSIVALSHRLGNLYREIKDPVAMRAEQVHMILADFIDKWPKVYLPNSYGTGSPIEEASYRFLTEVIWRIEEDIPERRIPVLDAILDDPRLADFNSVALNMKATALRERAHEEFRAPKPAEISGMLDSSRPASVEDLRALLLDELGELQLWLRGAETDPLETYYINGRRVDENSARNRIVDRLAGRMQARGVSINIEQHMAGSNRCDIAAMTTLGGQRHMLVVEVKGQWHKELYTAAAEQLNARYSGHPDAANQGIYLVLWFGRGEKVAGKKNLEIKSPEQLRDSLLAKMPEALRSRIDIFVLDLALPSRFPENRTKVVKTVDS